MSSPFAALGLDENADERAVKRAYAQRLKSARPDEDADAFQALNGAYKAALAALRWRLRADDAAPGGEPTPVAIYPSSEPVAPPIRPEPPAAQQESTDLPFGYATPGEDGGIEFDFDAFSAAMFAVAADPGADLAAWLHHEMGDWPLTMKPTLAPYVLHAVEKGGAALSPERFSTLVRAFGLDDVHSRADPVAVELLRKTNEQRFVKGDAIDRARRLLEPSNGHELDKAVRARGYPPLVAPILARLVTGPGAERHMGLRWMPLLARWVMGLLRYVSADTVDALSPPIKPEVLARWQAADRRIGMLNIGHWMSFVFLAFFIVLMIYEGVR